MGMTNFGPLSKSIPVPSFHPPTLNPQTFPEALSFLPGLSLHCPLPCTLAN